MKHEPRPLDIAISRRFDALPEVVFAQWINADALKDWFAPDSYTGVRAAADARVGGAWMVEFQSPTGESFTEHGIYKELSPHSKLIMSLHQSFTSDAEELTITVTFEASSGGTLMHFHQTGFTSLQHRDGVAEGWQGCLDKLANRVGGGSEGVEALFEEWFAASARKDLDGAMAPIAKGIVSYEHSIPLEVRDIERMRAECKVGFDRAGPDFRWDIPDLQIIVRGDIAVTWGLNRMADYVNGAVESEMWSRGTRIFQRIEGRWQMIHQHVSFPMDPATGKSRLDLVPQAAN
jgi:uncharacterized protein YndB with AHSA1/START domain/ketosteroid isomerase-like protein